MMSRSFFLLPGASFSLPSQPSTSTAFTSFNNRELIGSTKNATAGPASDIDILLHVQGNEEQRKELTLWLEGWSRCLAEINFLRTGYRTDGLLDVHLVSDTDIKEHSSFAVKIDAITDPARKLPMKDSQA